MAEFTSWNSRHVHAESNLRYTQVLIVERWLLGRLRHRTFYSLAEVNAAIGELMTHLNEECPIRRLGVTRRQLLEQIDR